MRTFARNELGSSVSGPSARLCCKCDCVQEGYRRVLCRTAAAKKFLRSGAEGGASADPHGLLIVIVIASIA
jgi:hypothetical protein